MATPNSSRCRCSVCGHRFNSGTAFDKHRVGDFGAAGRRCRSPDEMRAAGMATNAAGCWISESMPISEKKPIPAWGTAAIDADRYQGSAPAPRPVRTAQRGAEAVARR
jgi:hypothetical protein